MTRLMLVLCVALIGLARNTCATGSPPPPPPPCPSEIYCHGPLLHTIQTAKIYEDSKTFVDMKMKQPPNETMDKFLKFMNSTNDAPNRNQVRVFVNETFEPAGQEFEIWDPQDWIPNPKFAENIKDASLRKWVHSLNDIWKDLGRKMKDIVKDEEDLYSIIWVPNPVIVPGGRFREFYYWDSYWIVQGLLLSEMNHTVKGMLENFLYIIKTYGHIPNGGRVYYEQRSQPPLFIPMVKLYREFAKDKQFIVDNIETMELEFSYWMKNHAKEIEVDGKKYTLASYGDNSYGPRPESYSEDIESASMFKEQDKKESYYSELKAAAESGWDFSSRWFILNATNKGNLTNIRTRSILPVDLNAILYWNAAILAEFYEELNNTEKASYYHTIAEEWIEAVTSVLWHDEVGAWLDYDMSNSIKRDYFYPTNIAPLWTGCYKQVDKDRMVRLVLKYLQNKNILYPGGIPTTVEHTGEQWDYPNAWPPLQHIMIVGLSNTENEAASRLAYEIAEKWIRSNYKAYDDTEAMFEKYDATVPGGHGGGGEYEVQLGFGWTNGIVMDLMYRYGSALRVGDTEEVFNETPHSSPIVANTTPANGQVATAWLALIISVAAVLIGFLL